MALTLAGKQVGMPLMEQVNRPFKLAPKAKPLEVAEAPR